MDTLKAVEPFSRSKMGYHRLYSIFDVLKVIDEKERHLICGYIRDQIEYPSELIIVTCIWYYVQIDADLYTIVDTFEEMGLNAALLQGIHEFGLEIPSILQRRAILPLTNGHNCFIQSSSSEWTSAVNTYWIAALQRVDANLDRNQVLIIAHTPGQRYNGNVAIKSLCAHMGINMTSYLTQDSPIVTSPFIPSIFASVGTNADHRWDSLKMIILHDPDGIYLTTPNKQIAQPLKSLPPETQICIFSSDARVELRNLCDLHILNENYEFKSDGLKEYSVDVERDDYKLEAFYDIHDYFPRCVIYCDSRQEVMSLAKKISKNITVHVLHDEIDKHERWKILKVLKSDQFFVLIATDAFAHQIGTSVLIINYSVPASNEDYVKRVGKGKKFGVITFVTNDEIKRLNNIENHNCIDELPMDFEQLFY